MVFQHFCYMSSRELLSHALSTAFARLPGATIPCKKYHAGHMRASSRRRRRRRRRHVTTTSQCVTTSSNKITDHCHIRSHLGSRYRLCSWMCSWMGLGRTRMSMYRLTTTETSPVVCWRHPRGTTQNKCLRLCGTETEKRRIRR